MWMDSQAGIKKSEREKSTSSAKQVDIRFKIICHCAQTKIVKPSFVKSGDMIADLPTKKTAPRMLDLRRLLKLKTIQEDFEEECYNILSL